jgi:hypothetical protein
MNEKELVFVIEVCIIILFNTSAFDYNNNYLVFAFFVIKVFCNLFKFCIKSKNTYIHDIRMKIVIYVHAFEFMRFTKDDVLKSLRVNVENLDFNIILLKFIDFFELTCFQLFC